MTVQILWQTIGLVKDGDYKFSWSLIRNEGFFLHERIRQFTLWELNWSYGERKLEKPSWVCEWITEQIKEHKNHNFMEIFPLTLWNIFNVSQNVEQEQNLDESFLRQYLCASQVFAHSWTTLVKKESWRCLLGRCLTSTGRRKFEDLSFLVYSASLTALLPVLILEGLVHRPLRSRNCLAHSWSLLRSRHYIFWAVRKKVFNGMVKFLSQKGTKFVP